MNHIRILSDAWEDHGKIWFVEEYKLRLNSTAVELTIKDSLGNVINRVVASNQIQWIEEGFNG